jgi:capsular polysaccharide biosynthesis protein
MDSISLFRDAVRHKWATLAVAAFTVLLLLYVLVIRSPSYQADGSYALVSPPTAPTASQIAQDPALKNVDSYNPYTNYGDLTVVASLVTQAMSSQSTAQQLKAQGISDFTVDQSSDDTAPIIEISATGDTAATAEGAANTVATYVQRTLANLQTQQHVNTRYQITTQQLNAPNYAQRKLSSTVRDAVAAFVFGLILWFVVLSIIRGLELRGKASRSALPREPSESDDAAGQMPPVPTSTDGFEREPLTGVGQP